MKSSSQYSHGVISSSGGLQPLRARSWPIRHAPALLHVHFFAAVNFIIRMSCWGAPGSGLIKSCRQVLTSTSRGDTSPSSVTDTDLPQGLHGDKITMSSLHRDVFLYVPRQLPCALDLNGVKLETDLYHFTILAQPGARDADTMCVILL